MDSSWRNDADLMNLRQQYINKVQPTFPNISEFERQMFEKATSRVNKLKLKLNVFNEQILFYYI